MQHGTTNESPHRATARTTVKLTPIQREILLEGERDIDRDVDEPVPVAPAAAPVVPSLPESRPRKRTVRMRVMNFRPLPHPHTDEVTATPRGASTSKTS